MGKLANDFLHYPHPALKIGFVNDERRGEPNDIGSRLFAKDSRFRDLLAELSQSTQFVIITHNRSTVQAADTVYGISMGADSASQAISLKLDVEKVATPAAV